MRLSPKRIYHDQSGGALVEATIVIVLFLMFVLGSVDFLMAMYQWNAAAKATAVGARIAAVSNPVSSDLTSLTGMEGGEQPGQSPPAGFTTRTCTVGGGGGGSCTGGGTFSASAMNTIVFGRGSAACGDATHFYNTGMCDVFPRIQPANVEVSYAFTGLGFAGRPGGPVPTISVSLRNLNFQFYFLGFMGLNTMAIPPMTTTITGEDLSSSAPS